MSAFRLENIHLKETDCNEVEKLSFVDTIRSFVAEVLGKPNDNPVHHTFTTTELSVGLILSVDMLNFGTRGWTARGIEGDISSHNDLNT